MRVPRPGHQLLVIGRVCVDLYGEQEGEGLEDTRTFTKSVGGSAGNIAIGAARLGIGTAIVCRVGNEALGRFVISDLEEASVDTSAVIVDDGRLTGVVMLAPDPRRGYPRVFLYENSADLAFSPDEISDLMIADCEAALLTGSLLASSQGASAAHKIVHSALAAGTKLVLDIDYRPVLWGVVGQDQGAAMFADHPEARERLRQIIAPFDLIVGTEEEFLLTGGEPDLVECLRSVRELTHAVLVLKRGDRGSIAFPGDIPDDIDNAVAAPAIAVETVNPVGAGDAFIAGFLKGWLEGDQLDRCLMLGNISGAVVASRLGCSAAMPAWPEIEQLLGRDVIPPQLGADPILRSIHHAAMVGPPRSQLCVLALDHRWQMEEMADSVGTDRERIAPLKGLLVQAFKDVAASRRDVGLLLDDEYSADYLEAFDLKGEWVGRPIEVSRSRPISFLGNRDPVVTMRSWPRRHVAKCMVYCQPDDPTNIMNAQLARLEELHEACLEDGRQLLIELQPPDGRAYRYGELAAVLDQIYSDGIMPTMLKTPPLTDERDWRAVAEVIDSHDPRCHGILVLGGSDSTVDQLSDALAIAALQPVCRGFAIGRAIFAAPARQWLSGDATDEELIAMVAGNYRALIQAWDATRPATDITTE